MLVLIGIALVLVAVFGGYVAEKGNLFVLLQPAELLIVGGAACGILLIANPLPTIRKILQGMRWMFSEPRHSQSSFLMGLRMLYEVFAFARKAGMIELEREVEEPENSRIFSRYPELLKDTWTMTFLCDTLRMLIVGVSTPQELDHLMDVDLETRRRGSQEPVTALHAIADSLPGLGIVAAVLGVVITMQAIGGSPETVGEKVAAALVGTFLGILLCYGVVGPIASRLETLDEARLQYLHVLRTATVAYARGVSPIIAAEYGRRSIPLELRPTFIEMETTIRQEAKVPASRKEQENADAVTAG